MLSRTVVPGDRRVALAQPTLQGGPDAGQQYAVLLLNEQQMAQLLQRPPMRQVNNRFMPANDPFTAYTRLMRHARIAMVVLVVLIAGATAWAWAPMPSLTVLPWGGDNPAPTIATGASFSLTVPSLRTAKGASDIAGRVAAGGVPAFTRARAGGHQVMVGPYVSLDEAERQQRQLARAGFGGARVVVDDSLRHVEKNDVVSESQANPSLVLVGVGDRMSLAIELKTEPRQLNTRRAADGTFTVEFGPTDADVEEQEWSAPAGVDLVRDMKVEEIAVTPEASFLRATLTMPRTTGAQARLEGRRVYIDLKPGTATRGRESRARTSGTTAATPVRPATRLEPEAPTAARRAAAVMPVAATTAAAVPAMTRESIQPLIGRFERLMPFLQSAAATASPDVLRALGSTIDELDASLRQFVPAPEAADTHGALASAVAPARRAIDAAFAGDRIAQAHQAAMLVEAAKSVMPK